MLSQDVLNILVSLFGITIFGALLFRRIIQTSYLRKEANEYHARTLGCHIASTLLKNDLNKLGISNTETENTIKAAEERAAETMEISIDARRKLFINHIWIAGYMLIMSILIAYVIAIVFY